MLTFYLLQLWEEMGEQYDPTFGRFMLNRLKNAGYLPIYNLNLNSTKTFMMIKKMFRFTSNNTGMKFTNTPASKYNVKKYRPQ